MDETKPQWGYVVRQKLGLEQANLQNQRKLLTCPSWHKNQLSKVLSLAAERMRKTN